jgi:hypothetical protein
MISSKNLQLLELINIYFLRLENMAYSIQDFEKSGVEADAIRAMCYQFEAHMALDEYMTLKQYPKSIDGLNDVLVTSNLVILPWFDMEPMYVI